MNQVTAPHAMTRVLLVAVVLMLILHQDFWLWDNEDLWLGFLPSGLGYQAGYSIAAACLWAWAMRFAWPSHIESLADEPHEDAAVR